jgi:hypothetical protein
LNLDWIMLSEEAGVNMVFERFQMNDSHPMLPPIKPNTRLMKEDSVLEVEEHCLYQIIIGSCIYLVISTRPNRTYPVSYLSQFLATLFQVSLYGC